ncbi:amidotransferase subunit B, mitochondrial [Scheffersomyces coipomensis]|uniref:amidotransferase subunit B, mitochondrial n=1 Tax=Scheffersomyces coipomensis TaxID=1788519 RepID=UPI00315C6BF1
MVVLKRLFHSSSNLLLASKHTFQLDPNYKFKCGIEIHTQLKTKYKLFSLSKTSFNESPNTNISYFDIGLPGSQPKLNPEALLLALKAAVALDCDISLQSKFDRKHYFYPDQPLGYQITQFYHPLAKEGRLELDKKFDDIRQDSKIIGIEQIQIEQDTGKLNYNKVDNIINIDYNRSNTPLIELVTKPDFEDLLQVRAFVKKYQSLVRHLNICTGDLETGAIRVDVNISVNGFPRIEIKNLSSHSEIQDALKYEYTRQVSLIKQGKQNEIVQETRGWDGDKTTSLRLKENSVEYRYLPDAELPMVNLDESIINDVKQSLSEFPEQILSKLINQPFNLELKYARFFIDNPVVLQYYYDLYDIVTIKNKESVNMVNNWLLHELIGVFTKLDLKLDLDRIPASKLGDLIMFITSKQISTTSARLLLMQMIENKDNFDKSVSELIELYDLGVPTDISPQEFDEAVEEICHGIISDNADVVEKIKHGQKKSIKYLVGLAMRETQGKVNAKTFEDKLQEIINTL